MIRLVGILFLALVGCARGGAASDPFTEVRYAPTYASGFTIVAEPDHQSTLLRTYTPWQGAQEQHSELLIRRGGEPIPASYKGQVIEGNARRVVCLSSSYVALFDAIGEVDAVVAVSGLPFITNSAIRAKGDRVADIGYDSNLNYELLLSVAPDLVLLYGVSNASEMEHKLRELQIPYLYMGEYLEQSPLGKAEWMVFAAELLGRREVGEERFKPLPERYEELRSLAASATHRPKVMLNTPYRESWYMPSVDNYIVRLIGDAGGDYIYPQNVGTTSVVIDLEEAYLLCAEADYWLNFGPLDTRADLQRQFPRFANVDCVRRGAIYNNNRRATAAGGNDFWESGVVHPDLVLRDLIRILHPELMADTVELTYYKPLE